MGTGPRVCQYPLDAPGRVLDNVLPSYSAIFLSDLKFEANYLLQK